MNQDRNGVWERRYRDLEQQFEYLLLNVAESMKVLERTSQKSESSKSRSDIRGSKVVGFPPEILKVVKSTNWDESYVYCVANGMNMEYKFEFFSNKKKVQDTGYTRLNSSTIDKRNIGVVDTCRVWVKSDYNGKRHELTRHSELSWGHK